MHAMQMKGSAKLESPAASCIEFRKTYRGFVQRLLAQFGKPEGFWGSVAGTIMAHRPSNRERNRWTISLLDVEPGDRILEIGFGPGFAIQEISNVTRKGFVAGVDHSETMLRQARNRNAAAIREGRVALHLASVENLPRWNEPFDKIFAANSFQFWPEPVENLRQLRQLLRPGGRIAITYQPRHARATDDDALRKGQEIMESLRAAGFCDVRLETKQMKPVCVVCALGVS